jgi:carboxymethylenebutenolidase
MAVKESVRAAWVTYPGDGVTVRAYLALPEGPGPWPGVVMIHENPGLTEHRQDVTRRLAAVGYVVLTPDLFSRIGGKPPEGADDHERHLKLGLAVPDEQVHGDLMQGYAFLKERAEVVPDRIGLIGFCMGGAKGLYTACHSTVFRCFVDFYGPVEQSAERYSIGRSLLPFVRDLSCPIQFHVGAQDTACTPEQAQAFREELARHGKVAECYEYPGAQHAFHGEGERHHPTSAALAWDRTLDFFQRYL